MVSEKLKGCLIILMLTLIFHVASGQSNVPLGIHYQAVARDNYGKELINEKIDVRFSIISGSPDGMISYMEVHSNVITSKFGVFSLVIGKGVRAGGSSGELVEVEWSKALHFLKVEVKFENDYVDMGTMQFLAVPYALFAQKSLEPGPPGPRGETGPPGVQGDPASDKQTLSFDGSNLSISGGNTLTLNDLLQNLTVTYQPDGTYLGISKGNSVKLANIESDGDPTNEIQDITINSDKLKITNNLEASEWDLTRYLDNKDEQKLTWDPAKRRLGISGDTVTVGLSELKNDADSDPGNEIQDLTLIDNKLSITDKVGANEINLGAYLDNTDEQELNFTETGSTKTLSITGGNSITLNNRVAFRAKKIISDTGLSYMSDYNFIAGTLDYTDDNSYDPITGVFTTPKEGIYTFNVGYTASGFGESRTLKIKFGNTEYEILNSGITSGTSMLRSITLKLNAGQKVNVIINTGSSTESGTGSFSGYLVY